MKSKPLRGKPMKHLEEIIFDFEGNLRAFKSRLLSNTKMTYHSNTIMKKAALLLSIPFLLFSCGGNNEESIDDIIERGDLQEIRQHKSELSQLQSELTGKIDKLDNAIDNLDKNRRLDLVNTRKIQDTLFKHYAEVQGDVATDENIIIYPEFTGILTEILVNEGDRVSRGQVLARIDDGGLSSEVAQLETQVALSKTTFERQERLWEQNIGSEMQYLEAKTNYEGNQNALKQLKAQVAKTVVRAPFSGTIDEIISDPGEVVSPGQNQLFRLVSLKNMYVEADVPENYLNTISKGTGVKVEINTLNDEFEGEVRQVGNNINPNNRTFKVKVAVPNKDGLLKPNQIATIKLNDYTSEKAIIIPENVVQRNAHDQTIVYVLEDFSEEEQTGVAVKKVVKTGLSYQDNIEITSGLNPNEELIIEGAKNLRDGQEVKIRNEEQ